MQTLSTLEAESLWLKPHPKLQGASLMDHLFSRMNGAYPNKWRSSFRDEYAVEDWKLAWSDAFDDEGIAPQDIAAGIKNCRRMYDWPPSLTEFLRACRPTLDPEVAFHEAVAGLSARRKGERGEWSHPAIYYASVAIGQQEMLGSTYGSLKARWGKALSDQLDLGHWEPIPDASVALPAPARTELSDEQAKTAMERMGADGALDHSGRDHKAWARKILDSPKGRTPTIVAMARRALDESAA